MALSTSTFCMSFAIRSPIPFSSSPTFSLGFFFASDRPVETFLVALCDSPHSIPGGFWLLPPSLHPFSVFILCDLTLLPPSVDFLFLFDCSHVLLVHPCRPSATSAWFPEQGDGLFLSLEEVILENQPAFLDLSFPQNCLPWESSKQICEQAEVCSLFISPKLNRALEINRKYVLSYFVIFQVLYMGAETLLHSLQDVESVSSFFLCHSQPHPRLNCGYIPHVHSWFWTVCP